MTWDLLAITKDLTLHGICLRRGPAAGRLWKKLEPWKLIYRFQITSDSWCFKEILVSKTRSQKRFSMGKSTKKSTKQWENENNYTRAVKSIGPLTNGFTDVKDYELLEGKSQLKWCLLLKVITLICFFKVHVAPWLTKRLRNAGPQHGEHKWTWTCDAVSRKRPNHREETIRLVLNVCSRKPGGGDHSA